MESFENGRCPCVYVTVSDNPNKHEKIEHLFFQYLSTKVEVNVIENQNFKFYQEMAVLLF